MGLFNKNNKQKYVVNKRTIDVVPFVLYTIESNQNKKNEDIVFISPIYGTSKPNVEPSYREIDTDPSVYDTYRSEPIKNNESELDQYRGFRTVDPFDTYKDLDINKEPIKTPVQEVAPEPIKVEPVKVEPVKVEPIQEPIHSQVQEEKIENIVQEEPVLNDEPTLFKYNPNEESKPLDSSLLDDLFGVEPVKEPKPQRNEPVQNPEIIEPIKDQVIETTPEPISKNPLDFDEEEPKREEKLIEEVKEVTPEPVIEKVQEPIIEEALEPIEEEQENPDDLIVKSQHNSPSFASFKMPPLRFLKDPVGINNRDEEWLRENAKIIDTDLEAFKVGGRVENNTVGPTFTRFEVQLDRGVAGSKINNIANDLQRDLRAKSIRIQNPIPGKPYVGIEVPNKNRRTVSLKELIDAPEFTNSNDPLLFPVGLDVEGKCRYISVGKLPHALVAGASGSGKSVFINTMIVSLLYRNTPETLRFFFIDPKKVDLQPYAGIPHMLSPIVEDAKVGVTALNWLIDEMERRFALFRITKTFNFDAFNEYTKEHVEYKKMPYIVMIIDECADFMMNGGNEAQDAVTKLIQKCRAAGMYLFLSMQKPVAKLLSTAIKSNASGRFALKVTSDMDSRTILDEGGADTLLGYGDMIFSLSGESGRYQSAYVDISEINAICDYLREQAPADYYFDPESMANQKPFEKKGGAVDPLFEEIARFVVSNGRCSINVICQRYGVGFNRANQIVAQLEQNGIVSNNLGTKARQVLIEPEQIDDKLRRIRQNG